jgi:hypothetical protein
MPHVALHAVAAPTADQSVVTGQHWLNFFGVVVVAAGVVAVAAVVEAGVVGVAKALPDGCGIVYRTETTSRIYSYMVLGRRTSMELCNQYFGARLK